MNITVISSEQVWQSEDGKRTIYDIVCSDGIERKTYSDVIAGGGDFDVEERIKKGQGDYPDQIFVKQAPKEGFSGGGGGGKKEWKPGDRDEFYVSVSAVLSAKDLTVACMNAGLTGKDPSSVMACMTELTQHCLSLIHRSKEYGGNISKRSSSEGNGDG